MSKAVGSVLFIRRHRTTAEPTTYYKPRRWMVVGPYREKRDLWIGAYWDYDPDDNLLVYICLLPTIVVKVTRNTDETMDLCNKILHDRGEWSQAI